MYIYICIYIITSPFPKTAATHSPISSASVIYIVAWRAAASRKQVGMHKQLYSLQPFRNKVQVAYFSHLL
jgi:hypothetical protein